MKVLVKEKATASVRNVFVKAVDRQYTGSVGSIIRDIEHWRISTEAGRDVYSSNISGTPLALVSLSNGKLALAGRNSIALAVTRGGHQRHGGDCKRRAQSLPTPALSNRLTRCQCGKRSHFGVFVRCETV